MDPNAEPIILLARVRNAVPYYFGYSSNHHIFRPGGDADERLGNDNRHFGGSAN
jgi:hypothetical protein